MDELPAFLDTRSRATAAQSFIPLPLYPPAIYLSLSHTSHYSRPSALAQSKGRAKTPLYYNLVDNPGCGAGVFTREDLARLSLERIEEVELCWESFILTSITNYFLFLTSYIPSTSLLCFVFDCVFVSFFLCLPLHSTPRFC